MLVNLRGCSCPTSITLELMQSLPYKTCLSKFDIIPWFECGTLAILMEARETLEHVMADALSKSGSTRSAVRAVCLAVLGVNHSTDQERILTIFPNDVKCFIHNDVMAAMASGTMGKLHGCVIFSWQGVPLIMGIQIVDEREANALISVYIKGYMIVLLSIEYSEWTYADPSWARVAALVPIVVPCAEAGDEVAILLLFDAVQELASSVKAVVCRLKLCGEGVDARKGLHLIGASGRWKESPSRRLCCRSSSPLILERPFLRTTRALIDVYGEELTLRVSDEAITFKVGNTSRYSYNDAESINRIDVIDIAYEEYSHEVLGFFDNSESGNPTTISEPIIAKSSSSLTLFEGGDFILEEIEACFANDSIPLGIGDVEFDSKGDIRLIEEMLNNDLYSLLPLKDLKCEELKSVKSSFDKPPELKLKDLPSHLEYAFLEGTNKLPIIIAKNLKDEENERLIKVLKSHKQAIAWKLSDIKGIDPQFCTHKILMEDDFKPAFQHQIRVNPKIHEVIKKEVVKLHDARLIYPISDSLWVSPMDCVPKKGGMTVVTNEDNGLIPNRVVTGWRVYIDYRKLNDATRKDHFSLPFMDQMLERLAGNEYYCFLDGFFGYFQIPIDPQNQEKTTFTCPYGTFAYRRMPFCLCNAPGTFQRCMMAIFHDMIEETIEVFMDVFSTFGFFLILPFPFRQNAQKVRRHQSCSKLGEVPLHGQRGHCPRPQDFEIWD
ncbi:reverse transcriptase domain-containing protein [Tanacetum coccineum]